MMISLILLVGLVSFFPHKMTTEVANQEYMVENGSNVHGFVGFHSKGSGRCINFLSLTHSFSWFVKPVEEEECLGERIKENATGGGTEDNEAKEDT